MAIKEKIRIEDMNASQREELLSEIAVLSKRYELSPRVILEKFIANSDLGVSIINAMTYKREEELLNIMIDTLGPEYVKNTALSNLFEIYTRLLKEKSRLRRELSLFIEDDSLGDTIRIGNLELLLLQLRDLDGQAKEETALDDIDSYMNLKDVTVITVLAQTAQNGRMRLNSLQQKIVYDKIGEEEFEKIVSSYQNGTIAVSRETLNTIVDITSRKTLPTKNAKILEELKMVYSNEKTEEYDPSPTPKKEGPVLSKRKQ